MKRSSNAGLAHQKIVSLPELAVLSILFGANPPSFLPTPDLPETIYVGSYRDMWVAMYVNQLSTEPKEGRKYRVPGWGIRITV